MTTSNRASRHSIKRFRPAITIAAIGLCALGTLSTMLPARHSAQPSPAVMSDFGARTTVKPGSLASQSITEINSLTGCNAAATPQPASSDTALDTATKDSLATAGFTYEVTIANGAFDRWGNVCLYVLFDTTTPGDPVLMEIGISGDKARSQHPAGLYCTLPALRSVDIDDAVDALEHGLQGRPNSSEPCSVPVPPAS